MSKKDNYASVASNLTSSQWLSILSKMEDSNFRKLKALMDKEKSSKSSRKRSSVSHRKSSSHSQPLPTLQQSMSSSSSSFNSNKDSNLLNTLSQQMKDVMDTIKTQKNEIKKLNTKIIKLENNMKENSIMKKQKSYDIENDEDENESKQDKSLALNVPQGRTQKRGLFRKLKTMANVDEAVSKVTEQRKKTYYFGSRRLYILKPSKGYPTNKESQLKPRGKLELNYIHGYNGNSEDGNDNLYLSNDNNYLIYFIAAVCVVYDIKNNKQHFFTAHNDDITALCVSPDTSNTLIASGQKDPKDTPGEGKDLPKIWIWDYKKLLQNKDPKVKLIDNVCWGKISCLEWSKSSKYLYCLCGDDSQQLKLYDSKLFNKSSKSSKKDFKESFKKDTYREFIVGMRIKPKPSNKKFLDEIVLFGKRKFSYLIITYENRRYNIKLRAISISKFKDKSKLTFLSCEFLPNDYYAVGTSSGTVYMCKGFTALSCQTLHSNKVSVLYYNSKILYSGGYDNHIKKWALTEAKQDKKNSKDSKNDNSDVLIPKLIEKYNKKIEILESDFVFEPKAFMLDSKIDVMYIGSNSNQIISYNLTTHEPNLLVDGHDKSIMALCVHPSLPYYITGSFDNTIKLWDANDLKCIKTYEFELKEGEKISTHGKKITCADWSSSGDIIAVGTEDSYIGIFNYPELELQDLINIPIKTPDCEVEEVSYVRFSPDSKLLAVAHMDSQLYIFDIEKHSNSNKIILQQWNQVCRHVAAPTHIQWNTQNNMLKTLTRDYEICHWFIESNYQRVKFEYNIPDPDTIKWFGNPLIAGWDVEGLYQSQLSWDGTDLNECSLSNDKQLICSGDDYGTVRIHNYPSTNPKSNRCYSGHAEFVVVVRFLYNDKQLISIGGEDKAIFQWKLHKNYNEKEYGFNINTNEQKEEPKETLKETLKENKIKQKRLSQQNEILLLNDEDDKEDSDSDEHF